MTEDGTKAPPVYKSYNNLISEVKAAELDMVTLIIKDPVKGGN